MPQTGPWTGDPVWLADVPRAEGVRLVEYPGWRDRGHGDFKDIRGVMVHHTGSDDRNRLRNIRPEPTASETFSSIAILSSSRAVRSAASSMRRRAMAFTARQSRMIACVCSYAECRCQVSRRAVTIG